VIVTQHPLREGEDLRRGHPCRFGHAEPGR
jgi:hypothetical protein